MITQLKFSQYLFNRGGRVDCVYYRAWLIKGYGLIHVFVSSVIFCANFVPLNGTFGIAILAGLPRQPVTESTAP
jgi:hypothetical protein